MTPEEDKYLCKTYPKLFVDRNKSPQETCMCWGFEIQSGWMNIISALCGAIQHHIDSRIENNERLKGWHANGECLDMKLEEEIPQVVVDQVKEKFGGLRFYYHGGDEYIEGAVRLAEYMSEITCEICGRPGELGGEGWISCRCESCRKQ